MAAIETPLFLAQRLPGVAVPAFRVEHSDNLRVPVETQCKREVEFPTLPKQAAIRVILETCADYRWALERVSALRGLGALAETNTELAALEGAIARYVGRPGRPDVRKARPREDGSDAM